MSANSEEDESLPENPVCSECEKLKKEFDFTTIPDDNDTKSVYQKDGFICSKCGKKNYFLPPPSITNGYPRRRIIEKRN